MIFLTVGNWHKGYDRLVEAVDRLKADKIIVEDVIAQIGYGNYKPANLQIVNFFSPAQFTDIITDSRIVLTHAGIGTIAQAIELGKPVIVVPRKAQLGECNDNHQWVTARRFEQEGKVLVAYEVSELCDKLKQAENFVPTKNQSVAKIIEVIEKFLTELAIKKSKKSNGV